ncbi:uncharacterized protein N7511_003569 [Penicillium nucicola]|uniref:uncharacterized protein n=1 Tax=Penicillium nucicola TaxID=1850975 RepID=UPI00254539E2|nr:uncharacterized protein N7511_003569 [Penicillium nucicola]KAJ5771518.1 hypothetical protein N7511_003569 [Penicillium nucicola]
MEIEDTSFVEVFLDACYDGELLKVQEALATRRLSVENLDEGLANATGQTHTDIVAALFDAGAGISTSAIDSFPGADLMQDVGIVRLFLNHGLDPNATGSNGEPILAFMADPVCTRELLSWGADPNGIGPSGIPIIVGAIISSDDTSLIEVLLEYGARIENDFLFKALRPRTRQAPVKTSFLLAKGLDPNQINAEWGTPLHYAVWSGRPNLVKILLDAGADPTARSLGKRYYGEPPLAAAEFIRIPKYKEEIIALLQSYQITSHE